jgi:hypothetical protein
MQDKTMKDTKKPSKLRELVLTMKVKPMAHGDYISTRLNAYKPAK